MAGTGFAKRLGRALSRVLPAERRDWAEALWAEAGEVPPGPRRLAWYAGGMWLLMAEVLMPRRIGKALLLALAVGLLARADWPGSPAYLANDLDRADVIAVAALLAGLPLLARRLLGPASRGWPARLLRAGAYAAVLALTVAKGGVTRIMNAPPPAGQQAAHGSFPPPDFFWFAEFVFLAVVAGYLAVVLALTAQRSRVAPLTAAIGAGGGLAFGVIMYAVLPLGLGKYATEQWIAGAGADPLVALAWVALFGGPVAAAVAAGRRYRGPGGARARIRQAAAAGVFLTLTGGLLVTALGTSTVALLPRAGWLSGLIYPGRHLLPAALHAQVPAMSANVISYGLILVSFPVIGLAMGAWTGLFGWGNRAADEARAEGQPGPEPAAGPLAGGGLAGA
jgi:hypothetical protein